MLYQEKSLLARLGKAWEDFLAESGGDATARGEPGFLLTAVPTEGSLLLPFPALEIWESPTEVVWGQRIASKRAFFYRVGFFQSLPPSHSIILPFPGQEQLQLLF